MNDISGLGKDKKKKGIEKIMNEAGEELQNLAAAEYMNEYYNEAGPKLAQQIGTEWEATDNLIKHECTFDTFEFIFVREAWVKRLVSDIKISKSSAMDSLSTKVLKDAF